MRTSDDVLAGEGRNLVPRQREPEFLEPFEDAVVAPVAPVLQAAERLAELATCRIDAQSDQVQCADRHLRAQLHAGESGQALGTAGVEEGGHAEEGVMVGQRQGR